MDLSKVKDVLRNLIRTARDGEKGYQDAGEHVKRSDLKTYFQEQSAERGKFARQLETELSGLGEQAEGEGGSVSAAMHRAWIDLKSNLGADDHSILASVEQGEDNAKDAYDEALKEPIPAPILAIIRVQAQSVRAAHDRVKSLRDSMAA